MKRNGITVLFVVLSFQLVHATGEDLEVTVRNDVQTKALQQAKPVSGKVTDLQGETLLGVSVSVKGSTIGAVTDMDGNYKMANVPENATLVFSYLGMKTIEITVGGRSVVDAVLPEDAVMLSEVVAIGYGTMKKKDLTGAVASVKMGRVENENPQRIADILRGNVPGLDVGLAVEPKGGGGIQIRGKNTLKAGSAPLIILDGNIFYSDLANINPNDIESIDILKDASSAAVYGARSANGVIIVTTKTAKEESKPAINFNGHYSYVTIAQMPEVRDHNQFITWRGDMMKSMNYYNASMKDKLYLYDNPDNLPSGVTLDMWRDGNQGDPLEIYLSRLGLSALEIANYKVGRYVDWGDHIFQNGYRQNYNLSLNGKSKTSNYYFSLGYEDDKGTLIGEKYKSVSALLKLESNLTQWLSVGAHSMFSNRDEGFPVVNVDMYRQLPPYGSRYEEDGITIRHSPTNDPFSCVNPDYDMQYIDRRSVIRTWTNNLYVKLKLPFGINYEVNFAPRFEYMEYMNHQSALHVDWGKSGGLAQRENSSLYGWEMNNILRWNKTVENIHRFELTLLANAEKRQFWWSRMNAQDFSPSDVLGYHRMQAGNSLASTISSNDEYSTADALMGRLFYSLHGKYMLTLSLRRDGYSAFGINNPYGIFPSMALGWIFTEENFLKNDLLTYGKLRISWGENGNRAIGIYDALSNLSTGKYPYQTPGGSAYESSYLYVSRMANADLKWEKKRSYNIGLDFGIRHDLFSGSIDAYKASTLDLLVDRKMTNVSGFTSTVANMGQVDNVGLEVALNAKIINRKNFRWDGNVTFYYNKNKIIHLYGNIEDIKDAEGNVIGQKEADDKNNRWFIGHPIDEIWNYKVLGIWQLGQEEEAKRYGQFPGDFRLQDVNDDGIFNDDDKVFLGNSVPPVMGSMRHNFTIHKHIQVSFMLYSKWGHLTTFNVAKNSDGFVERQNSYNTPYWTPENPTDEYSRIRSQTGGISFDVYRKRSFIRLDNITIGYVFPEKWLKPMQLAGLKLSGSIRNVFYWAPDWPDNFMDPETLTRRTPRYFDLGLSITL
jgi:TonB-linked SusC/RagA family outer membrane protein